MIFIFNNHCYQLLLHKASIKTKKILTYVIQHIFIYKMVGNNKIKDKK